MESQNIDWIIPEYDLKLVKDVRQYVLMYLIYKIWAPEGYTYTETLTEAEILL